MMVTQTTSVDCSSSTASAINFTQTLEYEYDGSTITTYSNNFDIQPSECASDYTYVCEDVQGSPLCTSVTNDRTNINFDSATGVLSVSTTDPWNQYPTTFTTIAVKISAFSQTLQFKQATFYTLFRMTDPCKNLVWTLGTFPFPTTNRLALIDDLVALSLPWNIAAIAQHDITAQYCGPSLVQFLMSDTNGPINTAIFTDQRNQDGNNMFVVSPNTDLTLAGVYEIYFTVMIDPKIPGDVRYPQNVVSTSFTVELYDKCVTKEFVYTIPVTFPTGLDYVLTDVKEVTLPNFVIDPSRCGFFLESITADPIAGQPLYTFQEVGSEIKMTFDFLTNLEPLGTYQLTFNLNSAQSGVLSHQISLNALSPCENSNYVTMTGVAPTGWKYRIADNSFEAPFTLTHDAFSIVTKPREHSVCGTVINYRATYEGIDITSASMTPITYDPQTRTFSMYTDSIDQRGMKTILINGDLDGFPATNFQLTFQIEFDNPCLILEAITMTPQPQQSRVVFNFAIPFKFELVKPIVTPSICSFNLFECAMSGDSPRTDLCNLSSSGVSATFLAQTGTYSFETLEAAQFPVGVYTFQITSSIGPGPLLSTVSNIELEIVNPCPDSKIAIVKPIADIEYIYSSSGIQSDLVVSYNIQTMAQNTKTKVNCGLYAIEFYDRNRGGSLFQRKFDDGLADKNVTISSKSEQRNFTVKADDTRFYEGTDDVVGYRMYLIDYPDISVDQYFQIFYVIQQEEQQNTGQNESKDEAQTDDDSEGSEEESQEDARPKITPQWLKQLSTASVPLGGEDLIYKMGDARNVYGEKMQVQCDFGTLEDAAWYDIDENMIQIYQSKLVQANVGTHNVIVKASYEDTSGQSVTFSQKIKIIVYETIVLEKPKPQDDDQEDIPDSFNELGQAVIYEPNQLQYDIITLEQLEEQKRQQSGPRPFIKEFNWDGLVRIAFSESLQLQQNDNELASQRVAIEKKPENNRRRLNEVIWKQESGEERTLEVVDAFDVKIINKNDEENESGESLIEWDIVNFIADELTIKLKFEDPINLLDQLEDDYAEVQFTFWSINLFNSTNTNEAIPLGTKLNWKVSRLVEDDDSTQIQTIFEQTKWGFVALGVFIMILALWCGPLLPVWMFINSLQLIVHIPLLRSKIPAMTNLLFLDYLNIIRLHIGSLNILISERVGLEDYAEDDYHSIISSSYYNELMQQCGYHTSILHNLLLAFVLLSIFSLIWILVALQGRISSACVRHEIWCNNFIMRFLYEIFFEVCLCLMISYTTLDFQKVNYWTKVTWAVITVISITAFASLCFLACLSYRGGPYVKGSYEPKSLKRSFWHFRQINQNLVDQIQIRSESSEENNNVSCDDVSYQEGEKRKLHESKRIRPHGLKKLKSKQHQEHLTSKDSTDQARASAHIEPAMSPERVSIHSYVIYSEEKLLEQINYCTSDDQIPAQISIDNDNEQSKEIDNDEEEEKVSTQQVYAQQHLQLSQKLEKVSIYSQSAALSVEKQFTQERDDQEQIEYCTSRSQFQQQNTLEQSSDGIEQFMFASAVVSENSNYEGGEQIEQNDTQITQKKYALEAGRKALLVVEAKIRVQLQSQVQVNPRYQTIFTGLKKNHPHNVAIIEPMIFLVRRITYAAIVIFLYDEPYIAALSLLCLTLTCFGFVIIYRQWESSIINQQHIVNEVALYILLLFLLLFQCVLVDKDDSRLLGYIMIAILLAVFIYNAVVIAIVTMRFAKLFMLKLYNKVKAFDRSSFAKIEKQEVYIDSEMDNHSIEMMNLQEEDAPYRPSSSQRGNVELIDDESLRSSVSQDYQTSRSQSSYCESSRQLLIDDEQTSEMLEEQKVACSNTSREMIRMLSGQVAEEVKNAFEQSVQHQTMTHIKGRLFNAEETKSTFMGVTNLIQEDERRPEEMYPPLALYSLQVMFEPDAQFDQLNSPDEGDTMIISIFEEDAIILLQSLEPKPDRIEELPELTEDDDVPQVYEREQFTEFTQPIDPVCDICEDQAPPKDIPIPVVTLAELSDNAFRQTMSQFKAITQTVGIHVESLDEIGSLKSDSGEDLSEIELDNLVQEAEQMFSNFPNDSLNRRVRPVKMENKLPSIGMREERKGNTLLNDLDDLFIEEKAVEKAFVRRKVKDSSDSEENSERTVEVGSLPSSARRDPAKEDTSSKTFYKEGVGSALRKLSKVKEANLVRAADSTIDNWGGASAKVDTHNRSSSLNRTKSIQSPVKTKDPNLQQQPRYLQHLGFFRQFQKK